MPITTFTTSEVAVPFLDLAQLTFSSMASNPSTMIHYSVLANVFYSQYYDAIDTGLNSRMNSQALIQSSVFTNVGKKSHL